MKKKGNENCPTSSIFQTFWKDDCCPNFLFLDLGTLDLHHRPGFDQIFWFWTQIEPEK
jgi:hypothetical protein